MTVANERTYGSVSPAEVDAQMRSGAALQLVDVREPLEHQLARVEGAVLIPLGDLARSLDLLDRGSDVVVMCHHGIRSAAACDFLARNGFQRIRNMSGGIDRWSLDVDPSIPRY